MQYTHLGAKYYEEALALEGVFGEARTRINEMKMAGKLSMGEVVIIPSVLNLLNEAIRNFVGESTGAERERKLRAAAESFGVALADVFEPWDMFVQYSTNKVREVREEND